MEYIDVLLDIDNEYFNIEFPSSQWLCSKCNEKRGDVYYVYSQSSNTKVMKWINVCGHNETHKDVYNSYKKLVYSWLITKLKYRLYTTYGSKLKNHYLRDNNYKKYKLDDILDEEYRLLTLNNSIDINLNKSMVYNEIEKYSIDLHDSFKNIYTITNDIY